MSRKEQDQIIGELVTEMDAKKKLFTCLQSKAERMAVTLRSAAQRLAPRN